MNINKTDWVQHPGPSVPDWWKPLPEWKYVKASKCWCGRRNYDAYLFGEYCGRRHKRTKRDIERLRRELGQHVGICLWVDACERNHRRNDA